VPRPAFIEQSTWGTDHIGVGDTLDGDYGRLLEAVSVKWLASPRPHTSVGLRVGGRFQVAA
jgi:hypothetical protein